MNSLDRFKVAQEISYPKALEEIKNGMKESHWMWFIFPQIIGLGKSETAEFYAIYNLEEARSYLEDEVLGKRLREISGELLKLETNSATLVFGSVDSLKLNSCMTLFDYISSCDVFSLVIDKFYDGRKDELTLKICNEMNSKVARKK